MLAAEAWLWGVLQSLCAGELVTLAEVSVRE